MKIVLIIVGILFIGFLIFSYRSVPENVERAMVNEASVANSGDGDVKQRNNQVNEWSMVFTGYGPAGKSHDGTFAEQSFSYQELDENGLPKNGAVVFVMSSVNTGISGLDNHLCTDDFFDCETYPESKFIFDQINQVDEGNYQVTGNLTFKGVEKSVSFNLAKSENSYSGEFLLDTASFGFTKDVPVESEVLVKISFII